MNITYYQDCSCEGWKLSMPQIEGAQTLAHIHGCGEYTGLIFKFCPWCGVERTKLKDNHERLEDLKNHKISENVKDWITK